MARQIIINICEYGEEFESNCLDYIPVSKKYTGCIYHSGNITGINQCLCLNPTHLYGVNVSNEEILETINKRRKNGTNKVNERKKKA